MRLLETCRLTVCRELTKKHETVFLTDFESAIQHYAENEPKGECVLVIEGRDPKSIQLEMQTEWQQMDISEHMDIYLSQGMDKKSAMKQVAKDRGVSKREIYARLID